MRWPVPAAAPAVPVLLVLPVPVAPAPELPVPDPDPPVPAPLPVLAVLVPAAPPAPPVVAAAEAAVPEAAAVDGDCGMTLIPVNPAASIAAPLNPIGRAQLEFSVPKICGMFTCTHRSWVRVMVTSPR